MNVITSVQHFMIVSPTCRKNIGNIIYDTQSSILSACTFYITFDIIHFHPYEKCLDDCPVSLQIFIDEIDQLTDVPRLGGSRDRDPSVLVLCVDVRHEYRKGNGRQTQL